MNNMKDWLIFYNKMDVIPFLDAIQNQFNAFYELFGQNLMDFLSLPGCAQKICYNFFDKTSPLICSFNKEFIREDFWGQLYGVLIIFMFKVPQVSTLQNKGCLKQRQR
jgi:hypothetical protein